MANNVWVLFYLYLYHHVDLQKSLIFREVYVGSWVGGQQSGDGSMKFRSGYTYTGQFKDNVPHGTGKFLYPNGDVEDAIMEAGLRHGQSRYLCEEDKTVEEVTFCEGVATGESKVINQSIKSISKVM